MLNVYSISFSVDFFSLLDISPRSILVFSGRYHIISNASKVINCILLYLINIHWLSVDFDWFRAGHAEGAILSCRMIILPSDVISA